jgi:hypothetical protein
MIDAKRFIGRIITSAYLGSFRQSTNWCLAPAEILTHSKRLAILRGWHLSLVVRAYLKLLCYVELPNKKFAGFVLMTA